MMTRRDVIKSTLAGGLAAALSPASRALAAHNADLMWKHYPADDKGFLRAPVLLLGAQEALLIDGGFNLPHGRAIAEDIRASGRMLKTIYVSQSDPDYYFGLGAVRDAFPQARVIAAPETVAAIKGNVQKKLEVWGPKLGVNGPQTLADVVMPEESPATTLDIEGHRIEIVNAPGLPNRRYLWVPSLEAIFGGVLVFGNLHVWTADTQSPELRAAWVRALDAMAARKPKAVVPGHLAAGTPLDVSAIHYTWNYLLAFEEEVSRSADSATLIAAMKRRYPDAGLGIALEIGAKVAKGEMKWG